MRRIAALLPLALAIAACTAPYGEEEPYGPSGYPEPYPPAPYPSEPYPPAPYPNEPYPPPPGAGPPAAGLPAPPLDRTRWRVIAINGRPVPQGADYSLEFDAGRLSARFGCNSLGAGYTQNGSTIDAGAIIATKMACPDMSWETQGSAVLDRVMTVSALTPHRITLTSSAGSIELMRQ